MTILTRDLTRRGFLGYAGAVAVSSMLGCGKDPMAPEATSVTHLTARPGIPTLTPTTGLSQLGLGEERDGVLYVPESYSADVPSPLFIALHGAGGAGENWASYYDRSEERGMIFLAPDSRDTVTWDLIANGRFKEDVEFLDQALAHTFARCRIDPTRIALGGFSDGATYALSLGVSNGDLLTHLVAYSPGFIHATGELVGHPPIFLSHGRSDTVLSFDGTRMSLIPTLEGAGYEVTFEPFEGGHEVPPRVSDTALDWFLGQTSG